MKIHGVVPARLFFLALLVANLLPVSSSWGQKPPPPANPQGPTLNPLFPAGVQRGHKTEIQLSGTNLAGPTGVSLPFPAKITIPTEGKDNAKVKVAIEVPADTPLGWYPFRYATLKGVSNLRVLSVDELPQLLSTGKNSNKASPLTIPVPSVVTGGTMAEQSDYFSITVKAGERLSFDCQARRIGSAMDAQMTIYHAKSLRELAFDNDSPGCQTDPRISYTFKEAGDYLVEIKDVLNRGGTEFFYRLRIGDFPLATTPIPMAAKRGTRAKIHFAGPAVDGVAAVDIDIPTDPAISTLWVAPKGASGLHGWPVPLAVSDHDEGVEQEPNNDPKTANRLAVPGGMTGRFQHSDDTDYYVFAAKKGQKLVIEAHTLEYSSPAIVYMVLKNAKTGADLAKSNPQAPPPGDQRIDFTAPDDLDYLLDVSHLHFAGGPSETYRITVRPAAPSFDLVLANERFEVSPGGVAAIPVQVVRKGYVGPIEISTIGASAQPGLSGTRTIKAGQNAALLMVVAKSDQPMGAYQLSIVGKATVDGSLVTRTASAKGAVMQSLHGLPYPPMHLSALVALAVKERPPFELGIKMNPAEGVPGGKATVTINAKRDAGFVDEITIGPPSGLPATISIPKVGAIAKGKDSVSFALDLNPKTPLGEYFVFFTAKTKHQGKEFAGATPPLVLVVGLPFDLKVESTNVSLKPGEKAKLKITAQRKGGYNGPIALDVRKLPAGVTAGKSAIDANKTMAEVEITAAPTAVPASINAVDVAGTATALNNLQNASPTFTVVVLKK